MPRAEPLRVTSGRLTAFSPFPNWLFGVKARKTAITKREELTAACTGKPDRKCGGQRSDAAGKLKKPVCLTMRAQAAKMRWSIPLAGLRRSVTCKCSILATVAQGKPSAQRPFAGGCAIAQLQDRIRNML
jgi:hypothetical protein